jgi:hypothetical protein
VKTTKTCETCKYWERWPRAVSDGGEVYEHTPPVGDCRINPPMCEPNLVAPKWPCPKADHWCGKWAKK